MRKIYHCILDKTTSAITFRSFFIINNLPCLSGTDAVTILTTNDLQLLLHLGLTIFLKSSNAITIISVY